MELRAIGDVEFRLVTTDCGSSSCQACRQRPSHGPYWFATWVEGGAPQQCFVGKHLSVAELRTRLMDDGRLHHRAIADLFRRIDGFEKRSSMEEAARQRDEETRQRAAWREHEAERAFERARAEREREAAQRIEEERQRLRAEAARRAAAATSSKAGASSGSTAGGGANSAAGRATAAGASDGADRATHDRNSRSAGAQAAGSSAAHGARRAASSGNGSAGAAGRASASNGAGGRTGGSGTGNRNSPPRSVPSHTAPWAILGLPSTATGTEIRRRYRELALKLHPDRGGDPEAMKQLNVAYRQLVGMGIVTP